MTQPYIDTVVNYFPSRSEQIDIASTANFLYKESKRQEGMELNLDPYISGILVREIQANIGPLS